MTAEQYVKQITKQIPCGKKRRQDIARQFLAEIGERTAQGENLADVMADMGSPKEIAAGFKETLPPSEIKKYKRKKILFILIPILLILALLVLGIRYYIPKVQDLEAGGNFSRQEVEKRTEEIITLLDREDYNALQDLAIPEMLPFLNAEKMGELKSLVSPTAFGERISFGSIYAQEVRQAGKLYAVCQVNVSYESVAITYTITLDPDMKLAGLYMK